MAQKTEKATRHLSHSSTECWAQCPRRWYLERVAKVPQAPAEALLLGTAVHNAFEQDGRNMLEGSGPVPTAALADTFEHELAEALLWGDADDLLDAAQRADLRARGHAILRAYVRHVRPHYAPLAVEESFTCDLGSQGRGDGTDGLWAAWTFTGRIDARVRLADGTLAILDWKSASKPWPQGVEHQKPQASAYLMAESVREPLQQAQAVVFVVFPVVGDPSGGYECTPSLRTTTRTNGQIDAYAAGLVATARQIERAAETGNYPCRTGPLCGWCSVLSHCREGRNWLSARGRKPAVPMLPISEVER